MNVKAFQLHKRSSLVFTKIQDKLAYDLTNSAFAISDGTTQSYFSNIWASALVESFISHPSIDPASLLAEFKEQASNFNELQLSKGLSSAIAKLDEEKKTRGGTATFVGAYFIGNDTFKITSRGDSCAFVFKSDGHLVKSWPFQFLDELDGNHGFINSKQILEDSDMDLDPFFKVCELSVPKSGFLVLATDAISRKILKEENVFQDLNGLHDFASFLHYSNENWNSFKLDDDDLTFIIIQNVAENRIQSICPDTNFSFEEVKSPTATIPQLSEQLDKNRIMELKNLQNQISELNRNLEATNKKVRELQNVILLVFLSFIMLVVFIEINPVKYISGKFDKTIIKDSVSGKSFDQLNQGKGKGKRN